MGRRQVVRHGTLNPAFGGSNPSAPATAVLPDPARRTLDDVFGAWQRRDVRTAVAAFSADGAFVGADGRTARGTAELTALFAAFLGSARRWRFVPGDVVVTPAADARTANARFRYVFAIARDDGSEDERPGFVDVRFRDGSLLEWRESGDMAQDTLTIDVTTTDDGNTQVYVLHGSLDIATSPSLRAALLDAAAQRNHRILVDLTQLEFLDSTGLGALIGAHKRAIEFDGSIRLIAQEGQILRLLRITGLLDVFHVYPSIDDALADDARLVGL